MFYKCVLCRLVCYKNSEENKIGDCDRERIISFSVSGIEMMEVERVVENVGSKECFFSVVIIFERWKCWVIDEEK